MFSARLALGGAILVCFLALGLSVGRAQEEEKPEQILLNKQQTQKLLDKAEDEYRLYLKRPEKALEFWAAMKFEMSLGKFDLAALHLKLLLEKQPKEDVDKELVKIENAEGLSSFLRLREVKKWSDYAPFQKEAVKNVDELIERMTGAVHRYLSDPTRIQKFIKQLDAETPEERQFALVQLERSRDYAVPYLIEGLQNSVGRPLHERIERAMLQMDSGIVPVFLEIFKAVDAKDAAATDLRMTLLDVVRKRGDGRAVPYLWHLSSAPQYPKVVRDRAKATLIALLGTDPLLLPPAKVALTQLAERYYEHKVRFQSGRTIRIWPWNGERLDLKPVELTPHRAEEFFGLRHAREALDLDATYQPAQAVLLSLVLERAFEDNLDQFLLKPMPAGVQNLLTSIDADLVQLVLERAMNDHKLAVILPALTALGERGEVRAARVNSGNQPTGVVRALYYPDRRVQFAAARALLKMPATQPPVAAERLVDVLRRFVASDATPHALAAYFPGDKGNALRKELKNAGFDAVLVRDAKEGLDKLHAGADFDVILLGDTLPVAELPYALAQLRGDPDAGLLPILVVASAERPEVLEKTTRHYRNVTVVPESTLTLGEPFKELLDRRVKDTQGAKLSGEERKHMAAASLDILWRMARGELPGYDVRPAREALWAAAASPDTAVQALEILGRLPGADTQRRLADAVIQPAGGKMRVPAAIELNRHLHQFGVLLQKRQIDLLKGAYLGNEEPGLKAQLAIVIGSLRPTPVQTGTALYQFRPEPPAPPQQPAEEKKEEKKE